jgi:hypothetical protein
MFAPEYQLKIKCEQKNNFVISIHTKICQIELIILHGLCIGIVLYCNTSGLVLYWNCIAHKKAIIVHPWCVYIHTYKIIKIK